VARFTGMVVPYAATRWISPSLSIILGQSENIQEVDLS